MEQKDQAIDADLQAKLNQLNGYCGFDETQTWPWVPAKIRKSLPKEYWPVFTITSVRGLELVALQDKSGYTVISGNEAQFHSTINKKYAEVVRDNCKGWKNFRRNLADPASEIPFKPSYLVDGKLTANALNLMHPELISSMAEAILERSTLTAEELQGLDF